MFKILDQLPNSIIPLFPLQVKFNIHSAGKMVNLKITRWLTALTVGYTFTHYKAQECPVFRHNDYLKLMLACVTVTLIPKPSKVRVGASNNLLFMCKVPLPIAVQPSVLWLFGSMWILDNWMYMVMSASVDDKWIVAKQAMRINVIYLARNIPCNNIHIPTLFPYFWQLHSLSRSTQYLLQSINQFIACQRLLLHSKLGRERP